jgi:hypothetical protein
MTHVERAGAPRRRNVLTDRLDEARQLYDQGWSSAKFGQHLEVNPTLWHALRKAGVPMRDGFPDGNRARAERPRCVKRWLRMTRCCEVRSMLARDLRCLSESSKTPTCSSTPCAAWPVPDKPKFDADLMNFVKRRRVAATARDRS